MTYKIRHGLQLFYGTFLSMGSICDLNRVLTDFMLLHIHESDHVGVHLTTGKDTWVFLSRPLIYKNRLGHSIEHCLEIIFLSMFLSQINKLTKKWILRENSYEEI